VISTLKICLASAIRFAGLNTDDNLNRHTNELNEFLRERNLAPQSPPTYAFYNPPWTLPFLRRNEVLVKASNPEAP
jgi:hypothetical protein